MQQLSVRHRTTYRYRRPVAFGEHRMMMRPRDSHDLRLLDATLTLQPRASRVRWLHDVFGNSVAIARFDQPADTLILESAITIERYPFVQPDYPIEDYARTLPFSYPAREVPDLGRTIERHYADPERRVTDWARRHINPVGMTQTEDFLIAITRAIQAEFRYEARSAPGVQSPVETLDQGSGTCRDFALFMMEAARSVGLAARFVSGYLYDPALDAPGRK
ncbi:MAG: transglutaminase family protein, partial [Alphaproteobacteria bacterium]